MGLVMAGITLPPQNAAQFAVRTLAQRPAVPVNPGGAKPDQAKLDETTAKRLQETRAAAEQAAKTLETSKVDIKAQRKQAAKQRLDMINEAVRTLKMFSGDPKTAAREAARLARELAKAVKEYTDAGGSGASAAAAPTAPAGGGAAAREGAKTEGKAGPDDGAAVASGKVDAAGAGAGSKATADGDAGAAGAETGEAAADARAGEAATESATEARAAEAQAAESATGKAADAKADGDKADGDKEAPGADGFAQQARGLAKKLKIFLTKQAERLRSEPGRDARQVEKDVKDALDTLRETEGVVRGLPGGNQGESPMEGLDMLV